MTPLAEKGCGKGIGKMHRADRPIERILFLGGPPDVRRLDQALVGQSVRDTGEPKS